MLNTRTVLILAAIASVAFGEPDGNKPNIEDILGSHGQNQNDIMTMLNMDSKILDPEIVLDSFLLTVYIVSKANNRLVISFKYYLSFSARTGSTSRICL